VVTGRRYLLSTQRERWHRDLKSLDTAFDAATGLTRKVVLSLDKSLVWHRGQGLRHVGLSVNHVGASGLGGLSLQLHLLALGLGLLLQGGVGLDSVQELLATGRVLDVLDSQVDSLLDVSVADNLVDDDANGRLGDVVHDTGLTVVVFVGHTLLDGTVGLDVDNVADTVGLQVGGEGNGTMLLEVTLEGVASTGSVTTSMVLVGLMWAVGRRRPQQLTALPSELQAPAYAGR
jgi:hypothetical protein